MNHFSAVIFLLFLTSCLSTKKSNNKLFIKNKSINIEVANTPESREVGLMNRKELPQEDGMLFIFDHEQRLSFWMKNTLIPLSIAYINDKCTIVDIQKMYPEASNQNLKTYPSKKPSKYALEMNLNWFQKNNIKVGDLVIKKSGTFSFCNN